MKKGPTYWLGRNLAAAGFPREEVKATLIPEWWCEECEENEGVLQHLVLKIAGFFRLAYDQAEALTKGKVDGFALPSAPGMSLKATARLGKNLNATQWKIYNLSKVLRRVFEGNLEQCSSLRQQNETPRELALRVRQMVLADGRAYVDFKALCSFCWKSNIILAYTKCVKGGAIHGAALNMDPESGNPVIVLCSKDGDAKQAFRIAHELGHILLGHTGNKVDDEDDREEHGDEFEADEFARALLLGESTLPDIKLNFNRQKAAKNQLRDAGRRRQVAPEILAWFLAREQNAYSVAGKMYPASKENSPMEYVNRLLLNRIETCGISSTEADDINSLTGLDAISA